MKYRRNDPGNWITKTCPTCDETFTCRVSQETTYCSRPCYQATLPSKISKTCPECETSFEFYESWPRTYCSSICAGTANITNIKKWKPTRQSAVCESCNMEFEFTPGSNRGRFCSKRCWGNWLLEHAPSGEHHPNWRGGYEPYYGPSWPKASRQARQRDSVCADCGCSPNGRALDVHHIIAFRKFGRSRHRKANALSNLITLCNACHGKREWQSAKPT
jgi:hypothetical protein